MEKPIVPIDKATSLPEIADALEILADAQQHVARIDEMNASDFADAEDQSHARFYAEQGLFSARLELQEVIIGEALAGNLTYDEAMELLRHYEFACDESSSTQFSDILACLPVGTQVLIKPSAYNSEAPLRGTTVSEPMLAPYADVKSFEVNPIIVVEVEVDGVSDAEVFFIGRDRITGEPKLASVVIGEKAIEDYLAQSDS